MPAERNWIQETVNEIITMGDIETNDSFLHVNSLETLKEKLTDIIAFLIDHNFEKLLWILYRIDVDEQKAKVLLSKHVPEETPAILADLIIQRQIKKEEFRKQYASRPQTSDDEDLLL